MQAIDGSRADDGAIGLGYADAGGGHGWWRRRVPEPELEPEGLWSVMTRVPGLAAAT
jgi:hypothetical protein